MPIFHPKIFSLPPKRTNTMKKRHLGFSFLELLVVLFLMGLMATLVIHQFFAAFEKTNRLEFQHLNRLFTLLRTDSILSSTQYFVIFDPKTQSYHVEQQQKEGGRIKVETPKMLRPHAFPKNFTLENLALMQKEATARTQYFLLRIAPPKPLTVQVDRSGFVTPFVLFFRYEEEVWIIQTKNIMGFLEMERLEDV